MYQLYRGMISRCRNPKHIAYPRYKDIEICERWLESFYNFLEDMGERPAGKTLDRKDGTLGYNKDNCRWSTSSEQAVNRKQYPSKLGEKLISEIKDSRKFRVKIKRYGKTTMSKRINTLEDAIELRDLLLKELNSVS